MFNLPWVRILFLGLSCRSCSAPNCPKMEHWTWSCGWRYDKELRVSIEERKVKSIMFIPEELTRTSRKRLLIWHISRIGFASIIWFPGPAILHPVQYKPPVRTEVKMAQLTKKSFLKHSSMKLPYIGLGTNEITTEEMETALNTALDAGYRHFDTAYRYNNEADIGRSLKKIFERDVEYFLKKSLEALQLDYVDLYLVHSPMGYKRPDDIAQEVPNFTELELDMETDLGMEAQVDAGRAKYIGISKFNSKQIQRILDSCRIRPVNHQMEMQIYLQEKELVSFCQDNDITVTAFSPFGSPGIRSFEKTLSSQGHYMIIYTGSVRPVQHKPLFGTEVKMAPLTKKCFLKHSSMKLPYIGLGTMQIKTEEMDKALNTALDAGYRHFDTAYRYNNEADIGRSLKKIFETLQLDYVDLYLVHSPMGFKRPDDIAQEVPNFTELELDMETDLVDLWKGMEAQVDAGRAKYIGISKFNSKQIQRILDNCRIRPVNLQMEMQIYLQEKELVSFCQDNDITVTAFSPFGSPGIRPLVKTLR
ncbi:unnamed protein product [Nezara viridula]|uniref:NADP-dependent oxidoreductase domain-containing protein n=1 Tax=Nezara viridula TaxID=85310 RepID=A0A9P0MVR2_NEZVI|nr:unnamed protein product [Nezara viridula]